MSRFNFSSSEMITEAASAALTFLVKRVVIDPSLEFVNRKYEDLTAPPTPEEYVEQVAKYEAREEKRAKAREYELIPGLKAQADEEMLEEIRKEINEKHEAKYNPAKKAQNKKKAPAKKAAPQK